MENPLLNRLLGTIDSLGGPGKDPRGYKWTADDIRAVHGKFSEEYGDPSQYINKGNLFKAIGKTLYNVATGSKPSDKAKDFYSQLSKAYQGKGYNKEKLLDFFNEYEADFDLLTDKGEDVAKDILDKESYKVMSLFKTFGVPIEKTRDGTGLIIPTSEQRPYIGLAKSKKKYGGSINSPKVFSYLKNV